MVVARIWRCLSIQPMAVPMQHGNNDLQKQTQTQMPMHTPAQQTPPCLRSLRIVALVEGATLLALVGIAVPLKHLAGYPGAVTLMGPIHGTAFLLYFWMVFNVVASGDWSRKEIVGLVATAFVPFGALLSAGFLMRKAATLAARVPMQQEERTA